MDKQPSTKKVAAPNLDRQRARGLWALVVICLGVVVMSLILAGVMSEEAALFVDIGMVGALFMWLLLVAYWQRLRGLLSPNIGTVILILLSIGFAVHFSSSKGGGVGMLAAALALLLIYVVYNAVWFKPLEKVSSAEDRESWLQRMKMYVGAGGAAAAAVGVAAAAGDDGGSGDSAAAQEQEDQEDQEDQEAVVFENPKARFELWAEENSAFVEKFVDMAQCIFDAGKDRLSAEDATHIQNNLRTTSPATNFAVGLVRVIRDLCSHIPILSEMDMDIALMVSESKDVPAEKWKIYYDRMSNECERLKAVKK